MPITNLTRHFLLTMLLLLLSNTALAGCQTRFLVGWLDWKPYQVWHNDKVTGMDIELLKVIMNKAGCRYELTKVPWERTMRYIKSGDLDLALGASKTAERSEWAYFSEPYRREIMALFVRRDEYTKWNTAQNFEQLAGLNPRVMALRGAYYGSTWNQIKDRFFVHQLNKYEQLIKMLGVQRTDVVLTDLYNGKVLIKELGLEHDITTLDWNASDDDIHMMFSKATVNPDDIRLIDEAIRQLRQSGTLKQVIDRYR
ncbi:substrate-binding periplasmic protein [Amphritea pacifica]|uniref:Transporter substrate-binding domain-containing protein n=1 Tax=Amphritea pacifica TaxID=2811233 RepID=A0ABS2W8R3_9GAMM|nr:transporter substrate-binding domain-containing protein [Amphritea pacifica]MBN0988016.1 transporter substrate-binding domain-containing protein [Amphritea pacifica]MBN1005664.1 transporter substrate-binding domain-containing protein [Amphritea pacifica]